MLGFVGIDLATRPLGRVELPHRALIGGAQPVWLVGPRRLRYKEWEGCRGSHNEVRRRHKPLLQKPYRSRGARGRREAPQLHHDDLADPIRALRRRPVPVEAGGVPLPAPTTVVTGPRARCPHLADSDFLASILDSINAIAPAGTSSSAPPPTDGLRPPLSLFSFVLV